MIICFSKKFYKSKRLTKTPNGALDTDKYHSYAGSFEVNWLGKNNYMDFSDEERDNLA